jgi:hypothetical protein
MRYQVEIMRSRFDKLIVEVNAENDEEAAQLALKKAKIADPNEWELDGDDYDIESCFELDDEDAGEDMEDDSDDE